MRLFAVVFAVLIPWLLFEPGLHEMRLEKAIVGVAAAFAAMILVPLALGIEKMRTMVAILGALLALSNFYFPDTLAVMSSHFVAGAILLGFGLVRHPVSTVTEPPGAPVTSSAQALLHEPQPGSA